MNKPDKKHTLRFVYNAEMETFLKIYLIFGEMFRILIAETLRKRCRNKKEYKGV